MAGRDEVEHARDSSRRGAPTGLPTADRPVFHEDWWLDAVAPGAWDAVTVERGGRVVARLPYAIRGPRRMRVLTQPTLTPFLGPWTDTDDAVKRASVVGTEMELQAELEAALPAASAFRQNFAPPVTGALPFVWAGYRAQVQYTYRLEDLGSEGALWEGLAGNIRREIKKARKRVEVRDDLDLDRFHAVWSKTFIRQGLPSPDRALLERIEAACGPRDARTMLFAVDQDTRTVHAVAYIVRDSSTAYYLIGGGDPDLRTSGAASLLLWEAIMRVRAECDVFDFEGSMLRPVERFFRAFGGRQTPYLDVSRATPAAAAALAVRSAWAARREFFEVHRRRSSPVGATSGTDG